MWPTVYPVTPVWLEVTPSPTDPLPTRRTSARSSSTAAVGTVPLHRMGTLAFRPKPKLYLEPFLDLVLRQGLPELPVRSTWSWRPPGFSPVCHSSAAMMSTGGERAWPSFGKRYQVCVFVCVSVCTSLTRVIVRISPPLDLPAGITSIHARLLRVSESP